MAAASRHQTVSFVVAADVTAITICINSYATVLPIGPVGTAAHQDATCQLSPWYKANYRIKITTQALEIRHMRAIVVRVQRCAGAWDRDSNWSWRAIAEGSEMPTPQAFLAHRKVIPSAFYDGPTRRIGVIITRFRLIGLVFIDRS